MSRGGCFSYVPAPERTLEYKIGLHHGKKGQRPIYGWDQTSHARQNYFLGWAEGYLERRRTKMTGRHASATIRPDAGIAEVDAALRGKIKPLGRHTAEYLDGMKPRRKTLAELFAESDSDSREAELRKRASEINPFPDRPGSVVVVDPATGKTVASFEVGPGHEAE